MRRNKGFTLIEVMVVLSVLAIIAILAYNFFGDVYKTAVKEAQVTKIINDLNTISDAFEEYERRTGTTLVAEFNFKTSTGVLGDTGILKAAPILDPKFYSVVNTGAIDRGYNIYVNAYDMAGDANLDAVAFARSGNAHLVPGMWELCSAFNIRVGYNTDGAIPFSVALGGVPKNSGRVCWRNSSEIVSFMQLIEIR